MSARKLSMFMILILPAVMALPHKNSYGIPADGVTPLSSESRGLVRQMKLISQDEAGYWTCPMHQDVRMSEPGECPVCGMDLTPVKKGANPENGTNQEDRKDGTKNRPIMTFHQQTKHTAAAFTLVSHRVKRANKLKTVEVKKSSLRS